MTGIQLGRDGRTQDLYPAADGGRPGQGCGALQGGWALERNRIDFWEQVEKFLDRRIGSGAAK